MQTKSRTYISACTNLSELILVVVRNNWTSSDRAGGVRDRLEVMLWKLTD